MITFQYLEDIPKARLPPLLSTYIDKLFCSICRSIPDFGPDDGHITLVTPTDTDTNLCSKIGTRWSDSMFEGVSYVQEYRIFHAVICRNNQCTISIIIPDEEWLDPAIRSRLLHEMA